MRNFLIFLTLFLRSFIAKAEEKKSEAIILENYRQEPNLKFPWKKNGLKKTNPAVFKIIYEGKLYFLTLGSLVQYSARLAHPQTKVSFAIKWMDWERNLAFLQPKEVFEHSQIKGFELSDEIGFEKVVELYYPQGKGGQSLDRVKLVSLDLESAPFSAYKFVHYTLSNKNYDLPDGGGIFSEGKLAGICFDVNEKVFRCIPSFTIKESLSHFVRGAKKSEFASLDFELTELKNPIPYSHIGTLPHGLKDDDVILEIDGVSIRENAKIAHKFWNKVDYHYLLEKKKVGSKVDLLILREGKKIKIGLVLQAQNSNSGPIEYYKEQASPSYYLVGGIVFQRLTYSYLRSFGENWERNIPPNFYHLLHYGRERGFKGDAIFISHVFPGHMSKGYENLKFSVLDQVGKISSINFLELGKIFNSEKGQLKFYLRDGRGILFLDLAESLKEKEFIKKMYSI